MNDDNPDNQDPLTIALPIGYDSVIVDDFLAVMRYLKDKPGEWYETIATSIGGKAPRYVHLILEVLADRKLTEYGTSPRGSWLTPRGEELLEAAEEFRSRQGASR